MLFRMVAAKGRLIIANLTPHGSDHGYLEACMGCWMTYRDETGTSRLLHAVPRADLAYSRMFRDVTGSVVFLELVHA
jgi:hypothetical protein